MRIEIDTNRDSQEDIRKAIALLQSFVDHAVQAPSKNIFETPTPAQSLFGALFDTPSEGKEVSKTAVQGSGGVLFGTSVPHEKEPKTKIEYY